MRSVPRPVRIQMDLKFSSFGAAKRKHFLSELSLISGVSLDEMKIVGFTSGCVIFSGEMDREAVARLVEYFEKGDFEQRSSELRAFTQFCKQWSIQSVSQNIDLIAEEESEKNLRLKQKDVVLFVHGWSGAKNSFGNFPDYVEAYIDCETAIYEYPTGLWENSPSLEFISRNLDNWVRARFRNAGNISIISHSMGGILVRRLVALQRDRKGKLKNIKQLTFIASPHNGAALADIGKHVPILEKVQLQELSPNSPFLFSLNSDWLVWMESDNIDKSNIRCIVGTNDSVVSVNNAMGLDPNAVPMLGAGHIDIVKPENSGSDIVLTSIMFLEEASFRVREVGKEFEKGISEEIGKEV